MNTKTNNRSRFLFDGQNITELAEKYSTPLCVFSEKALKNNVRSVLRNFRRYHTKTALYYAANFESVVANLQIIKSVGCNLEVSSAGELFKGLYADFKGSQIIFNGASKFDDEIEIAIINGIKAMDTDSEFELKRIVNAAARLKKHANVSIHVTPGKMNSNEVADIVRYARENSNLIRLKGFHLAIRPGVHDLKSFLSAFQEVLRLSVDIYRKTGYRPEFLNIGGGLPVPPVDRTAKEICEELSEEKVGEWAGKENSEFFKDVELILDPGRKVTVSAGIFMSGTGYKKKKSLTEAARPDELITLVNLSVMPNMSEGREQYAEVVLIREDGQVTLIKPAQKYGSIIKKKSKRKGEGENVSNGRI